MTIGDARARLAFERLLQVIVDGESPADQRRVVRIDDLADTIPDLDPANFVTQGGALQPLVDLVDLCARQPAREVLLGEERLDSRLGDQRGARAAGRQVASLNVGVQLLAMTTPRATTGTSASSPKRTSPLTDSLLMRGVAEGILLNDSA